MERAGVAAMALGIIDRCLDVCVDYANDRAQFGHPIGEFQLIQEKLARMEVARLNVQNLVFRCIEATTANQPLDLAETSAMKLPRHVPPPRPPSTPSRSSAAATWPSFPSNSWPATPRRCRSTPERTNCRSPTSPGGCSDRQHLRVRSGRHVARIVGNGTQSNARASRGRTTRQDDPVTRFGEFDDAAREYVISRPDAAAVDQLPGQRGLLRDHLQHRRRLLVLS